jgi:hypothetical protein
MAAATATNTLVLKMSVSLDGFVGGPNGEATGYFGQCAILRRESGLSIPLVTPACTSRGAVPITT